jgi:proteasome regulatory subunit
MNLADDVDLAPIAQQTDGLSGAEIASVATEAGMFAIRDERTEVRKQDFDDALAKIEDETEDGSLPVAFA